MEILTAGEDQDHKLYVFRFNDVRITPKHSSTTNISLKIAKNTKIEDFCSNHFLGLSPPGIIRQPQNRAQLPPKRV